MFRSKPTLIKKLLMAFSGIMMLLFVLGHLLGNSTFFIGAQSMNSYAHHLQSLGPLLWLERIFMLLMLILHVYLGINLALENRAARSTGYVMRKYERSDIFARTMLYSGLIILGFIIYHLLHLTFQSIHPEVTGLTDASGHKDVYTMVLLSFERIAIALVYILCLVSLLFHLSHGIASFFQTLGWSNRVLLNKINIFGRVVAIVLFVGFISLPLSVLLNFI